MGDPRRLKKKYESPLRPWDIKRTDTEKKIIKEYGLKKKEEIRRTESILRKFRRLSRELIRSEDEDKKREFFGRLQRLGLIGEKAELDDVLDLKLEDIMERRLQTIVFRKNLAKTMKEARQMIVHGHIKLSEKIVTRPSFIVPEKFEKNIKVNK